jgi:drug/metabolite transporter (DMT)-like permease
VLSLGGPEEFGRGRDTGQIFTSVGEAAARVPGPVRGIAWMLIAAVSSASMNGLIRGLSAELHAFEIAFFRNLFGLLVLLPLVWRAGLESLRTRQFKLHALRGGLNAFAMLTFFYAVAITPLATVAALNFTTPLFATLLVALILGERVGRAKALGLALGFFGALVIIRPGLAPVSLGEVLVVISSLAWAMALVDIKVLSRTETSLTITVYAAFFLTPITFLCALPFWSPVSLSQLTLLAGVGAFGSLSQMCVAQALREADASYVLPADFTKLIWASLIGFLAFSEVPNVWTFVGAAMIFVGIAQLTLAGRAPPP